MILYYNNGLQSVEKKQKREKKTVGSEHIVIADEICIVPMALSLKFGLSATG